MMYIQKYYSVNYFPLPGSQCVTMNLINVSEFSLIRSTINWQHWYNSNPNFWQRWSTFGTTPSEHRATPTVGTPTNWRCRSSALLYPATERPESIVIDPMFKNSLNPEFRFGISQNSTNEGKIILRRICTDPTHNPIRTSNFEHPNLQFWTPFPMETLTNLPVSC